ncbi:hypothetical protein K9L67_05995 [Candidatus Woesearchaeota archaeon]|nr:hypothetical protein [Candidatus Woesearchaeota archaeon]MCF7901745.1 hypothetical protein [Candidatus Woesearchaeota archaeon]
MKYLKLFENSRRYNKNLYWKHQLDDILNTEWRNISTSRGSDANTIKFETGKIEDEKDGYNYSVFFEGYGNENDILIEEEALPLFIKKFREEFYKHPVEYSRNFKKDPKILGDVRHYRESEKYNM